jgi:hypothetical protein
MSEPFDAEAEATDERTPQQALLFDLSRPPDRRHWLRSLPWLYGLGRRHHRGCTGFAEAARGTDHWPSTSAVASSRL